MEMRDLAGFQISAAFLFTRGCFVEEIPYDPFMYFHGEEQNLAARAYTRGWDIWHPNRVPLYHLYKRRQPNEAPLHWDKAFEEKRLEKWIDHRNRANSRLSDLLTGSLRGVYGKGDVRTISDLLNRTGFSTVLHCNEKT